MNCLDVGASHGKDVRGSINERCRNRLTLQTADVGAFFRADLNRIEAWGLAAHRMHASRSDFDIFSVPKQMAKQPFRNWAPAYITCTDKEDAFHDSDGASERNANLESNWSKSIECLD